MGKKDKLLEKSLLGRSLSPLWEWVEAIIQGSDGIDDLGLGEPKEQFSLTLYLSKGSFYITLENTTHITIMSYPPTLHRSFSMGVTKYKPGDGFFIKKSWYLNILYWHQIRLHWVVHQ